MGSEPGNGTQVVFSIEVGLVDGSATYAQFLEEKSVVTAAAALAFRSRQTQAQPLVAVFDKDLDSRNTLRHALSKILPPGDGESSLFSDEFDRLSDESVLGRFATIVATGGQDAIKRLSQDARRRVIILCSLSKVASMRQLGVFSAISLPLRPSKLVKVLQSLAEASAEARSSPTASHPQDSEGLAQTTSSVSTTVIQVEAVWATVLIIDDCRITRRAIRMQ